MTLHSKSSTMMLDRSLLIRD